MNIELKLHYQYGRVTPELFLTSDEQRVFQTAKIPMHISWSDMMLSLDEPDNPRYSKSSDRCTGYQPLRELTTEDLEQAAQNILGNLNILLLSRQKPALEIRTVANTPGADGFLHHELETILPKLLNSQAPNDQVMLQIGNKFFKLDPHEVNTVAELQDLQTRYERRFNALRQSNTATLEAYQREFNNNFERLRKQIAANIIVPPSLSVTKMLEHKLKFFAKGRDRDSDNPKYWFQLPFKLKQTKLRHQEKIYRLRKDYRIVEDGFFSVAFQSNGQESNRILTTDEMMQNPIMHNHSMSGASFCSGSYGSKVLDLAGDVIDQVIAYRNDIQDLLEIVNTSSWGSNRVGRAEKLHNDYHSYGWNTVVITNDKDDDLKNSGVDSQTGRGLGDLWELSTEDVRAAQRPSSDTAVAPPTAQPEPIFASIGTRLDPIPITVPTIPTPTLTPIVDAIFRQAEEASSRERQQQEEEDQEQERRRSEGDHRN